MSAGRDGYFFVYDRNGRNLMHPRQAELVGQDLWNMTDADGLPVIQALLKTAGGGGGFQRYAWLKPSTGKVTDKLAYVVMLERWGWMYGTGIYLDDVQAVVDRLRHETDRGVQDTMVAIASLVLVAVLLVFAGGVTLNLSEHRLADRKLQQLNQRLVSLQEEERARVARELHDGLSQLLASVKFQFELAGHQLEEGDARGAATLQQGTERLTAAIGEVRRISHALHPSLLDMLGFPAAVSQLVEEFRQRSALTVDYRMDIGETRLEAGTALALFRILQEALGNIERHAHATRVRVSVERLGAAVRLRVGDDASASIPSVPSAPAAASACATSASGWSISAAASRSARVPGRPSSKSRCRSRARRRRRMAPPRGPGRRRGHERTRASPGGAGRRSCAGARRHPRAAGTDPLDRGGRRGGQRPGGAGAGRAARPDLLLVDIGLKDMNGLELTRRLGERHPQIRILILSMYENQEYVSTSVKVGARGYVLKDAPSREIVAAIKAVAEGGTFYTGGLAGKLDAADAEDGGLTPRERQVLVLLAQGLNNKQMARELAISVRTVETHRLSIRRKLDIDKPADLVTHAIKYGWQPD